MQLSLNQCRQLARNAPLRETVERLTSSQPPWLDIDDLNTIQAVQQGDSGAYRPAVTYGDAARTMAGYGDDILAYLTAVRGGAPDGAPAIGDHSWAACQCLLLSTAVEVWCATFDLDGVDWD